MESFNFGAFDPTIGARIAAIPQEAQKQQTANMLQAMQMQGAMNQNELARYSLASAQRTDASQNAVNDALKRSIVDGKLDYDVLTTNLAAGPGAAKIPDFLKARREEVESNLKIDKLKGDVGEQAVKAIDAAWKPFSRNAFAVRNDDNNESIISHHTAMQADPLIGPIMRRFKTPEKALKDDIAQISTPAGLRQWVTENTNLDPKELARLTLQITKRTENVGDKLLTFSENLLGQQIGPRVDTPIQMTPGQVQTAKDALAGRQQSERHFQAGGYTYDLDRGIRIDRNGIATPLMQQAPAVGGAAVGGGVSANAPVSGGIPTGRGSAAGLVPLGAKPEKLNESQGNATAFGLRMKESEAILEDLARRGVLRGAMVESIPFVGGAAGKLLPSTLGGTTQQEQQVNQAKSNFITAVLRKESGAVISDSEFEREDNKYFPQLNDKPKVIQQKANARRLAIEAMKFQAGPGAKEIDKYVPSINAETLSAPSPSAPPIQSFRRP